MIAEKKKIDFIHEHIRIANTNKKNAKTNSKLEHDYNRITQQYHYRFPFK